MLKSFDEFKETNKYDADRAGWDNAVAGLQIMISCPKGWGTHTPKCFLNHHHHRQHFTQPPPLPKCPPPLTEIFLLILIVWVAFRAWLNPNEGNVGSLPVTSTHLHRLETGEVNQCDARPNMAKWFYYSISSHCQELNCTGQIKSSKLFLPDEMDVFCHFYSV